MQVNKVLLIKPPRGGEQLLSLAEAARMLGLKAVTLRAWVAQRRIAAYKLGRVWRVSRTEIDRLLEHSFVPSKPGAN